MLHRGAEYPLLLFFPLSCFLLPQLSSVVPLSSFWVCMRIQGWTALQLLAWNFLSPHPPTTETLLLEGSRDSAMGVLSEITAPSTGKCCEVSAPFLAVLPDPLVDSLGNVCRGPHSEHPCVHSVSLTPAWDQLWLWPSLLECHHHLCSALRWVSLHRLGLY